MTKWSPVTLTLATPVEKELDESFFWLGLSPLLEPVPVSPCRGGRDEPHGLWVEERRLVPPGQLTCAAEVEK